MQKVLKSLVNLFNQKSSKKLEVSFKYFDSIDTLSAESYFKVHETGNHAYLVDDETITYLPPFDESKSIWYKILDQKNEVFGMPSHEEKYIILLKNYANKLADTVILEGPAQGKANMFFQMAEADLKAFLKNNNGLSMDETIDLIERDRGQDMDMANTSTRKFFARLEVLKKRSKRNG